MGQVAQFPLGPKTPSIFCMILIQSLDCCSALSFGNWLDGAWHKWDKL